MGKKEKREKRGSVSSLQIIIIICKSILNFLHHTSINIRDNNNSTLTLPNFFPPNSKSWIRPWIDMLVYYSFSHSLLDVPLKSCRSRTAIIMCLSSHFRCIILLIDLACYIVISIGTPHLNLKKNLPYIYYNMGIYRVIFFLQI